MWLHQLTYRSYHRLRDFSVHLDGSVCDIRTEFDVSTTGRFFG